MPQQPEPYRNIHKPRARAASETTSKPSRADPAAMEDDDDDFTFPTTIAAATVAEERRDVVVDGTVATPAAGLGDRLPLLPGPAAPGASRLWPFAAPLIDRATTAATTVKEHEEAPASTRRKEEEREQERATAAADEDRMDMLWDATAAAATSTTTAPAPPRAAVHAEPAGPERRADANKPAAAVAEQERMDLLWESFNEDLLLRRARSSKADHDKQHSIGGGATAPGLHDADTWYLCPSSTWSDSAESDQETSASASSPRYGCAPTMLRASSRAGGAGQFYGGGGGSPRRRRSGGGWALLLRLFRRLFAVDNKAPSRRHGIQVP